MIIKSQKKSHADHSMAFLIIDLGYGYFAFATTALNASG